MRDIELWDDILFDWFFNSTEDEIEDYFFDVD